MAMVDKRHFNKANCQLLYDKNIIILIVAKTNIILNTKIRYCRSSAQFKILKSTEARRFRLRRLHWIAHSLCQFPAFEQSQVGLYQYPLKLFR